MIEGMRDIGKQQLTARQGHIEKVKYKLIIVESGWVRGIPADHRTLREEKECE